MYLALFGMVKQRTESEGLEGGRVFLHEVMGEALSARWPAGGTIPTSPACGP